MSKHLYSAVLLGAAVFLGAVACTTKSTDLNPHESNASKASCVTAG